ncbi:MAG: hypothetical protein DRQ88_04235 [Epsilonproteobacteria bacterium]|nr:MAG: hypothetical protein DRQ89_00485 [Campylobacterota bacterium]RLA67109.1 MAG: hypothetical protein DRQ88_04235 [Campylobacterota bacterium]
MKRPSLVHFLSIKTNNFISIKASITYEQDKHNQGSELERLKPQMPIEAFKLLRSYEFDLKFVGLNSKQEQVYVKCHESDQFGNFNFKIPLTEETSQITAFLIFEIQSKPGLELLLGIFMPITITSPIKLVICDFDKTLVETRYSSYKEVYNSLIRPLEYFPTIEKGVTLLKDYIEQGFHPFILSASPHFYEDAMRDWLYKKEIYTAGIFLKDYRQVFSIFKDGELRPKDIKMQGLYKLNHLLDILLMTGIPDELVLIGDNFEADPIIYLTLAKILQSGLDPRSIWKRMLKESPFKISRKQNFLLLNKIFQLDSLISKHKNPSNIKVFIRKRQKNDQVILSDWYEDMRPLIELFSEIKPLKKEESQTKD